MTKKFHAGYFFMGVLLLICSFIAFAQPVSDLFAVVFALGALAIVKGIVELTLRRTYAAATGTKGGWIIFVGIVDIIFGILIFSNVFVSLEVLPFVFAIWVVIQSILDMVITTTFKDELTEGTFWFTIIIDILTVVIGIMLMYSPIESALTLAFLVAIYFLIYGVKYLVTSFEEF